MKNRPDEKAHKRVEYVRWLNEIDRVILSPSMRKIFGSAVIGGKVREKGEEKAVKD